MRKRIAWAWEKLDESCYRAKVIGGWIVLHTNSIAITDGKNRSTAQSESMVFLLDRDHEWEIAAPFNPSDPGKVHPKVNALDFAAPK